MKGPGSEPLRDWKSTWISSCGPQIHGNSVDDSAKDRCQPVTGIVSRRLVALASLIGDSVRICSFGVPCFPGSFFLLSSLRFQFAPLFLIRLLSSLGILSSCVTLVFVFTLLPSFLGARCWGFSDGGWFYTCHLLVVQITIVRAGIGVRVGARSTWRVFGWLFRSFGLLS